MNKTELPKEMTREDIKKWITRRYSDESLILENADMISEMFEEFLYDNYSTAHKPLPPAEGAEPIADDDKNYWNDAMMSAKRAAYLNGDVYIPSSLRDKIEIYVKPNGAVAIRGKKCHVNDVKNETNEQPTAEGAEEILKAEDYICEWCNKTYGGGKELEDWTSDEVMRFANDFTTLHAQKIADKMVSEMNRGWPDLDDDDRDTDDD